MSHIILWAWALGEQKTEPSCKHLAKGIERLVVSKETAKPILACDDKWLNKKLSKAFKQKFL
jgi:hypothetical protein